MIVILIKYYLIFILITRTSQKLEIHNKNIGQMSLSKYKQNSTKH